MLYEVITSPGLPDGSPTRHTGSWIGSRIGEPGMNASGGFAGRRQTHRLADCVEVTHVTQVTVAENPGTPDSTPKASIEYTPYNFV